MKLVIVMLRFLFSVFACAALVACYATAQNTVQHGYQNAAKAEDARYIVARQRIQAECGKYDDANPLPRSKAVSVTECVTKVLESEVLPYSMDQIAFKEFLNSGRDLALKYANGAITLHEMGLSSDKDYVAYQKKISENYQKDISAAYQADARTSTGNSQTLQTLGAAILKTSEPTASRNTTVNMPSHTNCTSSGNTVRCVEY